MKIRFILLIAAFALFGFTQTTSAAPTVITSPASGITQTSAQLNGAFNTNQSQADVHFEYGSTAQLGLRTPDVTRSTSGTFNATITGLTPGTTYYYQAAAIDSTGPGYGSLQTFTTSPAPQPLCVINSFSASPTTIQSGNSSTLSWNTSNCSQVSITNLSVSNTSGSVSTGTLTQTTTFTLSASGANGSDTKNVTVTVNGTNNGGSCTIGSFFATPQNISYGQSTTLTYSTTGCTSVSISPSVSASGTSGSIQTGPLYGTTTFTISGSNTNGGFTTSQITVQVSGTGNGGGTCNVNSFTAQPTQLTSGQSATLSWNTQGCTQVSISGGNITGTQPLSGSLQTGPLQGTTTFTLLASGTTSISRSVTVYATGGPYSYIYACSDGVDNDGDGLTDHPQDPGCYSAYDNDEGNIVTTNNGGNSNPINTSVITTAASNIDGQTARLNALVTNGTFQTYGYFEYGETTNLGAQTPTLFIGGGQTLNFYDTINVVANKTYYYRAVVQEGNTILRGSINSFNATPTNTTFTGSSSSSTTNSSSSSSTNTSSTTRNTSVRNVFANGSSANGVLLAIENGDESVRPGQKVQYQIAYANNSGSTLRDTKMTIVLPQGFTALQATQGSRVAHNTVEVDLGTLTSGSQGNIFLEAQVDQNVSRNETLVTAVNMEYTKAGVRDSSVAYVLNNASGSTSLGGLALGSGFFPSTIFGWLITILIILAIILFARRFTRKKTN